MTVRSLRAVFPVFAILAASIATPAVANCDWYVKTALEQQQRNLKLKCGFSGSEWSADKSAHASWCAGVGPDVSRATAQKREASLGQCSSK